MTTHTKSSALIFQSILQSKRSRLEKGFTLIELLVTVGLVGVLSATALPAFINAQEKGKSGALIGTIAGFAKECATNALTQDDTVLDGKPSTITVTPSNSGTECEKGAKIKNTTDFEAGKITGLKCGVNPSGVTQLATSTSKTCTFDITDGGKITGAWT